MILDKIIDHKRGEIEALKRTRSMEALRGEIEGAWPGRGFEAALRRKDRPTRIVAEIKKASPSAGTIRPDFSACDLARSYEENGAAAISVLTETAFFQGSAEHLRDVRATSTLPILRKDFVIDPYQIYEAKALGADAVLLIVAILDWHLLRDLAACIRTLEMDPLVEVHAAEELEPALSLPGGVIGVNNRNLATLEVDTATTAELMGMIPKDRTVLSESGISKREQIATLEAMGVHGFLIGEALVRERDVGKKLRELIGERNEDS